MQKRGISNIIVTVLLILLVIALIALLVLFVIPFMRKSLHFGSIQPDITIVSDNKYTYYSPSNRVTCIQIMRSIEKTDISKIKLVFIINGNSYIVYLNESEVPSINGKRYKCYDTGNLGKPDSVTATPISPTGDTGTPSYPFTDIPDSNSAFPGNPASLEPLGPECEKDSDCLDEICMTKECEDKKCVYSVITSCTNGDSCCPAECTFDLDSDCLVPPECTDSETQPCGSNIGVCTQGRQECVNGNWGICTGIPPADEICWDELDNDCDRAVDEDCIPGDGEIWNCQMLKEITGLLNYKLMRDINCKGAELNPILLSGNFNGNNHTISNFVINKPALSPVGFFSKINANSNVNNLGLMDIIVIGNWSVGGLAGINQGVINDSYVIRGTITGVRDVGGLVGTNYARIRRSFSAGNVYAYGETIVSTSAGGLVGIFGNADNRNGVISYSYSFADVISDNSANTQIYYLTGGFVGIYDYGTFYASYSAGKPSMTHENIQYLGGFTKGSSDLGGCCYWDKDSSLLTIGSGIKLSTTQMKIQSSFAGWDFANVWIMENNCRPMLRTINLSVQSQYACS